MVLQVSGDEKRLRNGFMVDRGGHRRRGRERAAAPSDFQNLSYRAFWKVSSDRSNVSVLAPVSRLGAMSVGESVGPAAGFRMMSLSRREDSSGIVRRRGYWSGPAVPMTVGQARAAVAQFMASDDVASVTLANVRLCVSEAVTNAIVHASADGRFDMVHVSVESVQDSLVITVTDNGDGFRPATGSSGLGLGLPLIAALADAMTVSTREQGGTEISMTFDLARARVQAPGFRC